MKKTIKAKRLILAKSTVRVLATSDLRDVVGGTYPGGTTSCICPNTSNCEPGESNNSCGICYEN